MISFEDILNIYKCIKSIENTTINENITSTVVVDNIEIEYCVDNEYIIKILSVKICDKNYPLFVSLLNEYFKDLNENI